MIACRFAPIVHWPRNKRTKQKIAVFRSSFQNTLDLLGHELRSLNAKNIIIQAFVSDNQIRNDGWLHSKATPSAPAIILTFDSKNGTISMPADTYDHWQDNLRAIALTLAHLRAVDRYGVTQHGEQYTGWKALPKPPTTDDKFNENSAADLLSKLSGVDRQSICTNRDDFLKARTQALRTTHPDTGGEHHQFIRVQQAIEVLRCHHQA